MPTVAAPVARDEERPWRLPWMWMGALVGVALQLQQPALWYWPVYLALAAGALVCAVCALRARRGRTPRHERARQALAATAGAALLYGVCGLRAAVFLAGALPPALEGQDIRITGVVAAMPQSTQAGLRLRMAVESAHLNGAVVAVPDVIDVSWYSGPFVRDGAGLAELQRPPPEVRAGERWNMTVRLKAPHGARNPQGFDYELYLWEQGVQASGYVRTGPRDAPPVRVAATWRYPVEQARQQVRDAILLRLTARLEPAEVARQRAAGVVAALVTGDQRAIVVYGN